MRNKNPVKRKYFIFKDEAMDFAFSLQIEGIKFKLEHEYDGMRISWYETV